MHQEGFEGVKVENSDVYKDQAGDVMVNKVHGKAEVLSLVC